MFDCFSQRARPLEALITGPRYALTSESAQILAAAAYSCLKDSLEALPCLSSLFAAVRAFTSFTVVS